MARAASKPKMNDKCSTHNPEYVRYGRPGPTAVKTHGRCETCARIEVEMTVARRVIKDLLAAGYVISVHDSEEVTLKRSMDAEAILKAMFTTDEDTLLAYKDGEKNSFVQFIYGNSGWDVISDYGVSLEPIMAPILKWAEKFEK